LPIFAFLRAEDAFFLAAFLALAMTWLERKGRDGVIWYGGLAFV
jgi:hypothetical protein